MRFFTLKVKGTEEYAEVSFNSNGDQEFCNSVQVSISFCNQPSNVWVVTEYEYAEKTAKASNSWWNADMDHPSYYETRELEIVELFIWK